jgi:hypothetical protein
LPPHLLGHGFDLVGVGARHQRARLPEFAFGVNHLHEEVAEIDGNVEDGLAKDVSCLPQDGVGNGCILEPRLELLVPLLEFGVVFVLE